MLPPEHDQERRRPVWDALQMLFMDTDVSLALPQTARACAESPYTIEELEEIYFAEVFPVLRWNLVDIAGEWTGYELEQLTELILRKHRFGKRHAWFMRSYASREWKRLAPMIREIRLTSPPSPSARCP